MFLPTGVITVTAAKCGKEKLKNENAIDSEDTSKPAPGPAKPKGARKAGKKAKPAKEVWSDV